METVSYRNLIAQAKKYLEKTRCTTKTHPETGRYSREDPLMPFPVIQKEALT